MSLLVYYPARPGVYAVLLFVGGFDGAIRVEMGYTDLLSRVSAHGFVVMGVDMRSAHGTGGLTRVRAASHRGNLPASPAQTFLQQLDWARKHLNAYLSNQTAGVSVDWEKTGIFCHSAGCAITLDMILLNHTGVKTGDVDNWAEYHTFMQGFVSAFFISTLQGVDDWRYLSNVTDIPIGVMNAKNDTNC
uniref:Uncharacterized protein n=1 Tax=Branchiostoma floridae TaxID=7739 RepID=C3XYE2_BRAFL|eukprot:XP_002610817.1 hypothetical protein BRAFLDRAFT_94941 [Branchiostoma floridae]